MQNFPKQRLSYAKKSASDFKWAKETMDAILTWSPQFQAQDVEYNRKLSNYKLFNNGIDQEDLARECNPLGLSVGQIKDDIKPYNKTYNKIQVLLGDELMRPFRFKALLVNSDGVRSKMEVRDSMVRNYIYDSLQKTIQSIQGSFVPQLVEQMTAEIMPPDQVDKYMRFSYRDRRETLSDRLLQYLYRYLSIRDKKSDAFKHALISGEEIVYVGVENDNPVLEVVNPLGFFFHKSGENKWIEDGLYAGIRTYMTIGEVLDSYGKYLKPEEIERLEENTYTLAPLTNTTMGPTMKYGRTNEDLVLGSVIGAKEGSYGIPKEQNILVQHVEWRSQRKIGFLSFVNDYGDNETNLVSEDFYIPPHASIVTDIGSFGAKVKYHVWVENGMTYSLRWDYVPEIWTATKIGHDIYCMIGPKEEQFRSKDNPFEVKLGYHGLVYNAMNADSVSFMDRMKPFQYLYLIVTHKFKKAIAQEQGKVFHFDISMVDPQLGLEKTLYYLKELNIDFYNPLMNADAPGRDQRGKVSHTSDMSNMGNIINYISILNAIDQQISEVAGVTKGREGQLTPNEAVSNAQSNIQMSTLVTEPYFQAHYKLWERILTSLVAAARTAWRGKDIVKQFVLDDMSSITLELSKDEPQDWEIGVFISDSGREHEMFQALKGISDGLLNTNRATFSDLIKLYEATSASELRTAIEASEDKAIQQQQQAQQAELQAKQQLEDSRQQFEFEKQAREHEHDLKIAYIESLKFQKDQDVDDNGIPDQFEVEKFIMDTKLKSRKLDLEEEKLAFDKETTKEELKIKRKQASKPSK